MAQTTTVPRGAHSHTITPHSFYSRRVKRPSGLRNSWQNVQPRPAPAPSKKGKRNQQSLETKAILETLVSLVKESHSRIDQLEKRFADSEGISPSAKSGDGRLPKTDGGPCALGQSREESKMLRLKMDQMESQTKLAEEQHDKLVANLRKSLHRSRNEVAILEAREEGRQLGRKEIREELLLNHEYPQLAPPPSRQVVSSILSSSVDEPIPTSAAESTISQTTEEDEKTPVPVLPTIPNNTPAEETQRQLVAVQLELQVAKQELEELQERTHEYKYIVQQPSIPGSPKGSEDTWEGDEGPRSKVETNALELDLHAEEHAPSSAPDMQISLDDFARRTSLVEKRNREDLDRTHKRAFDEANEKIRRREEKSRVANVASSGQWVPTPASQWAATLVTGQVSGRDPWHPEPGWVAPSRSSSAAASMSAVIPRSTSSNYRAAPTNPEPISSATDATSSYPLDISSPTIIQPHPSWATPRPENQTPLATVLTFVPTSCPCTYCRFTGASGHGIVTEVGPPVIP